MSNNYGVDENRVIGLIPARGGSKSIPLKNLAPLAGRPLIRYVAAAGRCAHTLDALYCSTDDQRIAQVCRDDRVSVIERPSELGADDTPVTAVIRHVLEMLAEQCGAMPGIVALLQPTSPFLLPGHIDSCVAALRSNRSADSAQTVTAVYHNAHAFNQRVIEDGVVRFRFPEERRAAYNKQRKPHHYVFGNLVVTRARALLDGKDCFGDMSVPVEIARAYALDVDTAEDLDFASYLIAAGKVTLP
jgi:CMP-N,N'-diacetyllegionaminic acid synthase